MKKHIMALVIAAACLLFLFGYGENVEKYKAKFNSVPFFEIEYPVGDWIMDDSSHLDKNTADYTWVFTLYNQQHYIICSVEQLTEYDDFSIFKADQQEIDEFVNATVEAYDYYNCKFTGMHRFEVSKGVKTAELPFLEYTLSDPESGESIYIETVSNGKVLSFEIFDMYLERISSIDEKQGILLDVLNTFNVL